MNNCVYRVHWTLPYQHDHVDRHDLADEKLQLCWVIVQTGARRKADEGTMYEPVYHEFGLKTPVPFLELADGAFSVRDSYMLRTPLPDRVPARAVGNGGNWVKVDVRPVLAMADLDEWGEDQGLTVAYALCDVVKEIDPYVIDLDRALHGRIRQILTEDGEVWEPFFYTWSQS